MSEDSVEWRHAEERAKEQARQYVGTKGKFDKEENKLNNMRGARSFLTAHRHDNNGSKKRDNKR